MTTEAGKEKQPETAPAGPPQKPPTGKETQSATAPEGLPEKSPKDKEVVPAELGDEKIFVKLTPEGKFVAVKAKIRLREENGHLYEVKNKVSISSLGFYYLNRYAGLSLVGPSTIQRPGGEAVPNPHIVSDPETGYTTEIWVRRIAIGFSPIGNFSLVDRVVHYKLDEYMLQELVNCLKYNPAAGVFLDREAVKEHERAQSGKRGWVVPINQKVVAWADLSHKEIISVLESHTQRMRFAERIATSIAERNCLRAHPAIGQSVVAALGTKPNRYVDITVYGFRHDMTRTQLERLATTVAEDRVDRVVAEAEALGVQVETDRAAITAGEEEVAGAAVEVEDNGGPGEAEVPEAAAPAPEPVPAEPVSERDAVIQQLRQAKAALADDKTFFTLMERAKIGTTIRDAPTETLKEFQRLVSAEVDRRAARQTK